MNTCNNCKHWDANPRQYMDERTSHGRCTAVRAIDVSTEPHVVEQHMAFIPADFDYMPLMTRSDFGCVRFEPKDD